jgi:hypothetical protein
VQQRRRVGRLLAAACAGLVLVATGGNVAVAAFTGRATATMSANTDFSAPANLKVTCSGNGNGNRIATASWTATARATGYIGSLYLNKQLVSTKVIGATTSYSFSASGSYTLSLVATYTLQGRSVATWTSAPATATFTC